MKDRFEPDQILRDRYRIVRMIGRGGMGEVYEALDLESGERVAVKTVLGKLLGNQKVIARFRREIELSTRISHPNVLRIDEVFELPPEDPREAHLGPAPCMVMELLAGDTLADHLEAGEVFPPDTAQPLVCQIALALDAAHRAEVVHRDLKPDNVFLEPVEGQPTRVVLTDFGVARPNNQPEQEESFTATDVIVGTPTYMAPEQLELEEAVPASDIYTLGLVVYEMLTGEFPFKGETEIQVVFMRVQEEPKPPRFYKPDLEQSWEDLILSCLARDPRQRPNAAAIARRLGCMAELEEEDTGPVERPRKKRWWPF